MVKDNLIKTWTSGLLFLNAFMTEAIFRQRSYADKSIDFQVILKMGLWIFTFIFCVALFRVWGRKLLRIDNIFQVLLLGNIFISCLYAPNFAYSAASAFSLMAVLSILLLASSVLDNGEIIRQIIFGCTLVAAISIAVYFLNPDLGRMKEWQNGVLVSGNRLSGITGTANAIGYISAMCLLALYYYRKYLPRPLPLTYWLFVGINVIALLMSNSRTSMLAMGISIAVAGLCRPTPARLGLFFTVLCCSIIFFSVVDYDWLFGMLSRSGDATEITTGTGRTAIWQESLRLIQEKPWFGWGYAATNTVLPAQSAAIGFTASHAHNAFLQITLSVGLVGLALFVTLLGFKTYYSIKSGEQLNIAFITFLLIDGLTEPVAFQGIATTTTLVLATVLALNYGVRNDETRHRPYQQRLSGSAAA